MTSITAVTASVAPATTYQLDRLPDMTGPVAVVSCGDMNSAGRLDDIVAAARAGWGYLFTYPGSGYVLTPEANDWSTPDDRLNQIINDMRDIEKARGELFGTVVELRHLWCAKLGFHDGDTQIAQQLTFLRGNLSLSVPRLHDRTRLQVVPLICDHRGSQWW